MFFLALFSPIILLIVVVVLIIRKIERDKEEYEKSAYYESTQLSYYAARQAGPRGEYLASRILEQYNLPDSKILFNVYLPTSSGRTTEIDIIVLSPVGILVIESKDYSGWIFGSESQPQWCQTLPAKRRKSQKNYFYNPIMQNRAHIKHLKTMIGKDIPMYSIILFSDRCVFKDIRVDSSDVYVIHQSDLPNIVWRIKNRNTMMCLNESDIDTLYNRLFSYSQVGEDTKEQHKMNIQLTQNRKAIRDFSNSMDEEGRLRCPQCTGYLIVRTAKRGGSAGKQFYGCSRFPECKYTRNIER